MTNFREWRAHILERLSRQVEAAADAGLVDLLEELKGYPVPPGARPYRPAATDTLGGIAVPLELAAGTGTLRFLSATTVFGPALAVSLAELTIESFFPAAAETAEALRALGAPP